ncbi:hypothetical protein QF026_002311 [Streptomyces aurantiacus]|uniref:Clp protease N-terminal domain-containing protein n=1 Tax=Streptomyces aurantiacus TaxID=47760 RepID=UPI002794B6C3|nr:hypothetical protein [Streptomyces aurantiacus]MDQ0773845.1 hypothetical protein [Streptomyces aurantiacus]
MDQHQDQDRDQGQDQGQDQDQRSTTGATTEFEPDVMDLLVEALRGAVRRESPVVGTEAVLAALVMGDTDAGAAIAPGMRAAGSLSGLISGRGDRGWANDDEGPDAPAAVDGDARDADVHEVDAHEVDTAWREAQWRLGLGSRGAAPRGDQAQPRMTGALRMCLLRAIGSARTEGTVSVRCRHVARALVDLPDSRAREALLLRRLDPAAAATALDGQAAGASARSAQSAQSAQSEGPESRGVTLLRRAGTLGKSGNRLTRAFTSWTSGSGQNGSPVLFAVSVEAVRQAVRCGRAAAEPVDLLLGILALDRALSVAGRSLPESLAAANAAPALLRRHGVRQTSLTLAAATSAPASDTADVQLSPAVDKVMAVAQLTAAEHGSPTVGTVHLLSALLGEPAAETDAGSVVRLLRASGQVDLAALRAELRLRLGA